MAALKKKVQDYLEEIARDGLSEATFVQRHRDPVLVEVEGDRSGSGSEEVAMTEKLDTAQMRRQSLSSREAAVLVLHPGPDGALRVGRAAHCELVIDHPSVSKEHARFTRKGKELALEDLGSTNGTFHNYRRLDPRAPVAVMPDDALCFGRAGGWQLLDPPGLWSYLTLLKKFAL